MAPGPNTSPIWLVVRLVCVVVAVAALWFGLTDPRFRTFEGHVSGAVVVPAAVGAGLVLFALLGRRLGAAAVGWFVLGLIGQAVALQLVNAGFMVGYQHYVPVDRITSPEHVFPLAFLAFQSLVVAAGLTHNRSVLRRWFGQHFTAWRLLLVIGVLFITSAALSRNPIQYVGELFVATAVQLLSLATFVLAAISVRQDGAARLADWLDRLLGRSTDDASNLDRFAWITAGFVLIACALLAIFSYQRHPHVPDEVVYLYHARYFARGWLSMPLPPVPEAFNLDLMTYEATRWYSPVPPGWPAVLAIGAFFGAAWLVNPVLNAINVLLAYRLLGDLYGRRTARLATLLLAFSPWFIFMGMNFMTHTWTMTAALTGALGVVRLRRSAHVPWGWVVAAGAGIGVLGLIRPLEGLTVAVLLGLWALSRSSAQADEAPRTNASPGDHGFARRLVPVVVMAIVAIATVSITFPYNQEMAGSPTTFPLMAYTDSIYGVGTNALGFGANRGLGWPGLDPLPGHGPIDVLVNGNLNVFQVNTELLGWSIGSLLPMLLLLTLGPIRRADVWMMVVIVAMVGIHAFYWFSGGPDFGARYWYLILLPCIALSARGIEALARRVGDATDAGSSSQTKARDAARNERRDARVPATALALSLAALVTFFPWRAIDKYFHYRNMRPDVRQLAETHDIGRAIVFVRGNRHPDYASAAIYNPLDDAEDAPIYVWDRGPDLRQRVLDAFPDRDVWTIDGPTITSSGFHITGGRIDRESLLEADSTGTAKQ